MTAASSRNSGAKSASGNRSSGATSAYGARSSGTASANEPRISGGTSAHEPRSSTTISAGATRASEAPPRAPTHTIEVADDAAFKRYTYVDAARKRNPRRTFTDADYAHLEESRSKDGQAGYMPGELRKVIEEQGKKSRGMRRAENEARLQKEQKWKEYDRERALREEEKQRRSASVHTAPERRAVEPTPVAVVRTEQRYSSRPSSTGYPYASTTRSGSEPYNHYELRPAEKQRSGYRSTNRSREPERKTEASDGSFFIEKSEFV